MNVETLVKQLDDERPFKTYLSQFGTTKYPTIYRNESVKYEHSVNRPFLVIFNSVTTGGKDVIMNRLIEDGVGIKARTATTRSKRMNEPDDHYVWMRSQKPGESFDMYYAHLIREYDLLEIDAHHGYVYGLPRTSLEQAAEHGVVIMQNEPRGARTLVEAIGDEFNILILFIVADSWQQMYDRMNNSQESRDNEITRLEDSLEWLNMSQSITHYYVHNTEYPEKYGVHDKTGIDLVVEHVTSLISDHTKTLQ